MTSNGTRWTGNAMANIHLALADEVLSSIEEKKTAKEIWDHLIKLYEATSLHNKIFLKRKLYTLRMPESTSVTEHLNTLNTLFSQLTSLSCKIGEQERAELILQSLPDSYDQLIINLTNSNVTSLVFDDVAAAVLQEEKSAQEQRRQTSKSATSRSVNNDDNDEREINRMWPKQQSQICLNKNSNPQGNTANTSDDGDALCCEASTTVEGRKRFTDIWLIDSGATYHMTSRREWFHHYEPVSGGSVYSCNDHALEIVGVGTIKLKMYDGTIKVVRDVRHVKGLKKNLLSYGLLDNNASKIETQKGIMKVFRGALVVLKCEKIAANLYMLKGETLLEAEASVASCSSDSAMLWHKKLGHMSEQGMKVLVEQKLLPSLTKVSLPLCEHCITSKQHRLKFNTSNSRGKSVLELVHSDVWQAPVTSLGRAKYFVSFIDDYSRRCWVYLIKKKSDVFATFKNFKARVELDSGNKIKCFRTDNGGEYTSEEFDDFCKRECIKRQFTVANTPQQNGVAERMNRTLLERTRAMLRDAGLEKSFWAEAVNTACYLVNRAPSTAIELKTPMEMWTGKPSDYSNLHVFGSIVYVMYNSQEISKLDPKSRKCKFLGYADGVKGYRLWDPTARKVIISRDVIFVEDKLQRKEDDASAEKSEITHIHVEKEVEQGDSSEAEPAHDEQELESSEAPITRQSDRVRRRPNWHSDYVIEGNITYCLLTEDGEPSTYQEAINSSDASLWMMAVQEEIEALHKNNTWDLVPLPQGRKPIGNKWVFKIKRNVDDQVERYRARLVVKGYAQKEGIDFNEIFSPVVRLTTVRVLLAMCATLNLHLEQLDVKTAFLHGNLEEEIYMLQPEGFEEKEKKNLVCRLNKSLYGLKQAPRCWYKRFDSFIMCLGYNRLNADPCAYFKRSGDNDFVILLLYVDDMLVAGPNKDHIEELKAQLAREFEMKDLGSANKILGMQIHRDRSNRKIWLSQKNYLKKILSRFSMQDCKPISTPLPINFKLSSSMSPSSEEERMEMSRVPYASAVGSLMFAMICTRPDIAQAVGVVSRYMANPGKEHWNTVKRILRYIKGTSNVALCYGGSNLLINGYVDSDYAGDLDKSKSTTGYVFKVAGGAVSWVSKLQSVVATSTTEAEYVAATQASKEAIWLKMLLEELGHNQEYVSLFCDSQSALHLARNPAFHSRTKHIRVQYHFIREKVEEGTVDMQKIHTKDNIADFMTKAINADKFTWCRSSCGLSETCDFALSDSRLTQHLLAKASLVFLDSSAMARKIRAMAYNAEEQVRARKIEESYLVQLAGRTTPKGLHCLSMQLTTEYFSLQPEERQFPNQNKLNYSDLYHYAVFSDNVLACAVVINSTISSAKEPEKNVFHVVTNYLNLPAISMWFLLNPPGKATIRIQSVESFDWLSTKNLSVLFDHDVVVQRDLTGIWSVVMKGKVNAFVETCQDSEASFCTMHMLLNFSDPFLANRFNANAHTWAYGMNLFDLQEWRIKKLTMLYRNYLQLGLKRPLWKAGSLPLGWMTFYNQIVALERRWHVLGLGYNSGLRRGDIDQAVVIHYDGVRKPWLEIGIAKYKGYWSKHLQYDHPYLQKCNIHE
ncbi:putative galacturonosyltransferase 6 [Hibiscus syriacus]|uniref:Galacturonosyltransferase 6 n=1 Tax=Hibiscus syriacus TaxID=106335 RepID=A0A6A3CT26_HIBSY|nr:putative galacturonosyltransferase 6 [Hibiscus syriacus]